MMTYEAELAALVDAICWANHAEFAATARRHTHLRLRPEDARMLAFAPFADVDVTGARPVATRFPVLDLGVVTVTQDPTMPPGCVDVYTPGADPWLAGTRDRPE